MICHCNMNCEDTVECLTEVWISFQSDCKIGLFITIFWQIYNFWEYIKEILWAVLGGNVEVKVFTFMQSPSSYQWPSKTIRPNSMPFQRYCAKWMILWINLYPQINSSLFSYILKRANIFSLIDFLTKIFTS